MVLPSRSAELRLLAGATMISFSGVYVKLVSTPPAVSAFWRVALGGLALSLWIAGTKQRLLPAPRVLAGLTAAGAFLAVDLVLWHQSIVYIGPGLATLLTNFQVFFLALAGLTVLNEPLRAPTLIAIPLAMVGLVLIVGLDWSALSQNAQLGVVFALLAALAYSGFVLTLRFAQTADPDRSASSNLAIASLCAALILGVFLVGTDESLAPTSVADMGWLLVYAMGSQVLAWVLITSTLTRVPAARVGLVLLAQPVLSFVWDVLFFSRQFTLSEGTGALIALFAIYLGNRRPAKIPQPQPRTVGCRQ